MTQSVSNHEYEPEIPCLYFKILPQIYQKPIVFWYYTTPKFWSYILMVLRFNLTYRFSMLEFTFTGKLFGKSSCQYMILLLTNSAILTCVIEIKDKSFRSRKNPRIISVTVSSSRYKNIGIFMQVYRGIYIGIFMHNCVQVFTRFCYLVSAPLMIITIMMMLKRKILILLLILLNGDKNRKAYLQCFVSMLMANEWSHCYFY